MLENTQSLIDKIIVSEKRYYPADLCSGFIENPVSPSYSLITTVLSSELLQLLEIHALRFHCSRSVFLDTALAVLIERYDDVKEYSFAKVSTESNVRLSLVNLEYDDKATGNDFINRVISAFAAGREIIVDSNFEKEIQQNRVLQQYFRVISNFEQHSDIHEMIRVAKLCNSSVLFSVNKNNEIVITYDSDRIESDYVNQIASHYINILTALNSDLSRQVGTLDLLSIDETQRAIISWNETSPVNHSCCDMSMLFDAQCVKDADALAVVSDRLCLTFSELNNRVSSLASRLSALGVSTESPVAVCMDRSAEHIISMLAIIKCNATYIPIDMNSLPQEQIRIILDDCRPVMLLTTEMYLQGLQSNNVPVVNVTTQYNGPQECRIDTVKRSGDDRFYILYTSGSSGRPKGVEGLYKGIVNRLQWMWDTYPFTDSDIGCNRTPIGFVDHIAEILSPLLKGVTLYIPDSHQNSTAQSIAMYIYKNRIGRIILVPSLLSQILHLDTNTLLDLSSLKYVFSSGEPLSNTLVTQFYQHLKSARLVNIYGSTEVSADVTWYEVKRFFAADVLRYFSQSIDLPGGLKESVLDGYSNPITADRITTGNVSIDSIASRFCSSHMADFPISPEQYYKRLYSDVFPFVINTASPKYIGHMTSALPDFVHDISKLISQLNQNLVKIETAKSLIFLERETLAVLHRAFYRCSDQFYNENIQKLNANLGLVTTGGTTANITALLTARNKALFTTYENFASSGKSIYRLLNEKGYADMTILGTHRMHYSIRKAISVLGIGIETILYVDTDNNGRLDTGDLQDKIVYCKKNNILVLAVIGIAGATESGQIDPLDEIGAIARQHGIHFHVDAAWGGTTIFSDTYKHKLRGIELADSITFCGHKQLYLPQGISICLFRDPDQLQFATTIASYQASADSYDVGKFTLEGSRSAISLCLHAALQMIGRKGYETLVNYSMDLTSFFAKIIDASSAFELIMYPDLNIVNYRYIPTGFRKKVLDATLTSDEQLEINSFNKLLQEKQFLKGKTFVSKTTLTHTRYGSIPLVVFRVVLSNPLTTYADLYEVLEDQLSIAQEINSDEDCFKIGLHYKIVQKEIKQVNAFDDRIVVSRADEHIIPIGKPIYNCKAYVLDRKLRVCPVGVSGELYISGMALARGYHNNESLTKECFVDNPFVSGEKMYKTGDRVKYAPDGTLEYLGRFDDQVKIQGYRVEPSAIEYYIDQIESVQQCKVIAITKESEKPALAAFIIMKEPVDSSVIREQLQTKLPDYMVPQQCVVLNTFPLLPSGKVDKVRLAEMLAP
jgi:putative pyridoxal-dependent aspartate 1-decarboxylase